MSPPIALIWLLSALGCTLATDYTPDLGTTGRAWDAEDSGAWVDVPVPVDTGIGPGNGDGGADDGSGEVATTVTAIPAGGSVPCASGDPAQPVGLNIQTR